MYINQKSILFQEPERFVSIFRAFVFLVAGMWFGWPQITNAQSREELYLSKNVAEIPVSGEGLITNISILDKEMRRYSVFMLGEAHGVSANTNVYFDFIKYFHQKAKVRYVMLELPLSYQYFLDSFMLSGDTTLLRKLLFDDDRSSVYDTEEYLSFFITLRNFNERLPAETKLEFICVDAELRFNVTMWNLYSQLPDVLPPKKIAEAIETLKTLYFEHKYASIYMKFIGELIKTDMGKNAGQYKKYLGANYDGFKQTVDNLVNTFLLNREKIMMLNFNKTTVNRSRGNVLSLIHI